MDCHCFANKTEEERLLVQYANQKPSDDCSKISYKNSFYAVRAFEVLQSFRNDEFLCDIKLQTDDGIIIFGHKVVLASATPYFRAMFTNSFKESKKDHVFIRDMDSTALQLLVEYIYTAKITITEDNAPALLHAADLLQIHDVRYACCEFLKTQLQPSNCLGFRALVSLYRCNELLPSFENYIHQHFSEVVEGDEFLSLPYEQVIELISCDKLKVSSEEKVFECVIKWMSHNYSRRKKNVLPKLMDHVRLPLISNEYLLNRVKDEPFLQNSIKCKDLIIDALSYHVLKYEQPDSWETMSKTTRYKYRQHDETTVVGVSGSYPIRKCAGFGVLNNHLFMVGGLDCSTKRYSKSVDIYCPILGTWTSVTNMLRSRLGAGVGVLNGVLYVVGGLNSSSKVLKSVEAYIPNADIWIHVADMHTQRKHAEVSTLDGFLYVMGGDNGTHYLTSVEMYNPKTDTWTLDPFKKSVNKTTKS